MNNDYPSKNVDVLYGIDNITHAIEKFIDEAKTTYDVCADSTIPSFIVNKGIITKFLDFKNKRNGRIRYITDVTGENIGYCKRIMETAQLRHLEGPKGVFRVSETECHYNVVLDEPRQMAIMIRSNTNEIVSQYQKIFDILWEKAMPVKERITEMEDFEESILNGASSRNVEKHTTSNRTVTYQPNLKERQQLKESIEKETEALLNTRIPHYNKNPPQPAIKIQLWSNRSRTEYAMKLKGKSNLLAATRQDMREEYTHLVEESNYLEDVQYDWNYTLRNCIDNHTCNVNTRYTDVASLFPYDDMTETSNSATTTNINDYDSPILNETQNNNNVMKYKTYSHQKGTFKCNYCKLMFITRIKRKLHEKEWHTATKPVGL
jgi:hypothetical protein